MPGSNRVGQDSSSTAKVMASPPPVGFEGIEMSTPGQGGQPPPLGFEGVASPSQDQLYPNLNQPTGPTPVEATGNDTVIGFEGAANGATEVPIDDERRKAEELEAKRETCFFRDGLRRIDYVLAYQEEGNAEKDEKRKIFEANLESEGLEFEREGRETRPTSRDEKTCFVKIHAPWKVLSRMAEILSFKMPIEPYDAEEETGCTTKCPTMFEISKDLIPDEQEYFTADFSREREQMFIIHDKDTFFTNSQRSLCVHELLMRARYDETDESKIARKGGIDRLLKQGAYTAAFPLHEGKYKSTESVLTRGVLNERHMLYETWARPGRWYCYQPLDQIRKYFGEKVGIYFAWLGFYTQMLIPASLVGLVCFLYGLFTLFNNPPSEEICDKSGMGNTTMCPLCDQRCNYWKLHSSCLFARATYVFDNPATVFFAGFMALWATFFLEFWKHHQATIQYDWDVANFEMEEHMRPDFEFKVKKKKQNPVTKAMEPYMPPLSKYSRRLTSGIVVLFMICLVIAAVFGVIMYRIVVVASLYAVNQKTISSQAKIITTCTAAVLNLIIILLLNRVYLMIAKWLTSMESPRTDTEFEDSFTMKMYMFQFVNFYSSIFYIAFFKGRLTGRPGDYDYSLGARQEQCDPAGCLIELCIQLAIVMMGKQAFNNFKELIIPKLLVWFRVRQALKGETEENLYTRWEQDKDLADIPALGLFDEYLEMVIQYGFVTIFVAAFPPAPLLALLNNVIEIRLDAYKFVTQWKRPPAQRAQDIGIWYGILKGITFLAVLSNAFIIGWTSDFVPKMVYRHTDSPDGSLKGYIKFSLSSFNVSGFSDRSKPADPGEFNTTSICWYPDFRKPHDDPEAYTYTRMFWHIFTARMVFVIVFEHAVFFATWVISYLIPDVPFAVKQMMLREMHLTKKARYNVAFEDIRKEKSAEGKQD